MFRVDIQLYLHDWKLGKREFVWKHNARPHNFSFFQFYNSQKNTKLLERISDGKYSVFILSCVNTTLNQSAFRIHKCYIINRYIL